MIFEVVYYFRSSKKMSNELQAKLDELWNRVQSNEESISIKKQILNECNEIITNTSIKDNRFLLNKLKLIIHKAGKPMNLSLLAEEFEAVAKLEPNNIDVYICLAETLIHEEKPDDAIMPLTFALTIKETPDIYILLSICERRRKEKNLQRSLDYANKAVKLDMKNGKAWSNIGIAYLSMSGIENVKNALKAFKVSIVNGQSNNADILMNLGTVYELLLDFRQAMKYYEEALKITQGWSVASSSLERLQNRMKNVSNSVTAIEKIRPKLKTKMLSRIKNDDEYIVADMPFNVKDPSQIILCFDKNGNIFSFGITQTVRSYLIAEKTIIKLKNSCEFNEISINGKNFPYHVIESLSMIKIIGGSTPSDFSPVSVSNLIA